INGTACNAHIGANTPDLKLGQLDVSDDPTYYNTGGDISITSGISTSGSDLAILASRNVLISLATISTTSAGAAGNILMVAGGNISDGSPPVDSQVGPTAVPVTITNGPGSGGGSTTGGSIICVVPINATGSAGANGGNVQMIAYSGSI